jgi:hypothetical protein
METDVANGITQLVIGVALAGAIGGSILLTPINKPIEDVAFLERVASTVERAQVIAPQTREYISELTGRHQSPIADPRLELRRQKALKRIMVAMHPTDRVAGPVSSGRAAE